MRIRKKSPKPSAKRPPLYFIGYRGTAPASEEVKSLYEREYSVPLAIHHEEARLNPGRQPTALGPHMWYCRSR